MKNEDLKRIEADLPKRKTKPVLMWSKYSKKYLLRYEITVPRDAKPGDKLYICPPEQPAKKPWGGGETFKQLYDTDPFIKERSELVAASIGLDVFEVAVLARAVCDYAAEHNKEIVSGWNGKANLYDRAKVRALWQ